MPPAPIDNITTLKGTEPDATPPSPTNNDLGIHKSFQDDPTNSIFPEPISLGAKRMLDEAGRTPKTRESYDVFIRGKTRTDNFLKLDLEQDHVSLTREQVSISIDIDSVDWVTTDTLLSCKGAVNLHLLPHFSDQAPFSANSSVYVTILGPPENEKELNNPHF